MRRLVLTAALCLTPLALSAAEVHVLTAARIHTSDAGQPNAEAMAWDDSGRVLALGDAKTLLARYPGAERIDAGGAIVIPGLIDAHAHLMGLGYALMRADLVGTKDKADILQRLREYEKTLPKDAWLLGGGWDQNDWHDNKFPTAADLDAAFPDRPVWLERVDGHAGWANSAAMRAVEKGPAGKTLDGDWQPDGGRILRQGDKATGLFVDGAMDLINRVVPAPDEAFREKALQRALQATASNGLTGVHDMGTSREDLALFRRFADDGRLPLRIDAYADGDKAALQDLCANGLYRHSGGHLKMQGVKLYMDGALGSRGAALLADYSDEPGNRGLLVTVPDAYEAAVRKAKRCGVQVATHAIGDRGNRLALDTYQRVLGDDAKSDHRWRIEHAQIVSLDDIPRFAKLGVIASMQPTHATSDMPWAQDRVGKERIAGAYAWRRFLDSGAHIALGSDFPVESVDPRLGLYAAATRQDRQGQPPGGWLADQKLSAAEALRGFTADAAYAGKDEKASGRLAPGLPADFVIVETDPLTMPVAELDDLKIRSTWIDGKPVYEAK
ncbi:amidohydrolase [Luteimonas sp. SX5]|uniref:Amidohydrolase n=1 Tax=Luteimonas galliterrae TaxID=2940486 RepID=A0ABT0MKS4_9GAMM|nr:amidohydrolase [Luteimonas galliterrae]MCL1635188.1 amidohydrolase [Luteimonas galliterrae]